MKDPVYLSGGDLGGHVIEGSGWKVGAEKVVTHPDTKKKFIYRRDTLDYNDETEDKGVFVGKTK